MILELTISYRSCSNIIQDHGSTKLPKCTVSTFSHTRFHSKIRSFTETSNLSFQFVFRIHSNDEIELTEGPFEYKPQPATTGSSMIDLIKINGPPSLQRKLRALCEEYSDIFDTTVRAESADIPPMSIKIDETKWKSNKHRLPPRTHSVEKQSQIRQQCDQLLELGVFRHSTANEWSLVHRVPKPTIAHPI